MIQRNSNRNSRSVSFPCECEFSLKKSYNKDELLWTFFSRNLATDKGAHTVQNICLTEQSFFNKVTTGCLLNFSFLKVCMHLIVNFICNDTIFERIFISDFSSWILVFSILNLHFSVNYKAFQSALKFLIFYEIVFLLYENCLSQSSSKWYFEQTWSFSVTWKKIFLWSPNKAVENLFCQTFSKILKFSRNKCSQHNFLRDK